MTEVYGVSVTCQGDEAWTDGKRIMLPSLPEPMDESLERMVVGFLDHEMAHVAFSDFDVVAEFVGRYPQGKAILNVVEDALIEKKAMERWPGVRSNLDDMFRLIRDRIAMLTRQRDAFGKFCTAVYLRLSHHTDMLGLESEISGFDDLLAEFPNLDDTRGSAVLAEKLLNRWQKHNGPNAAEQEESCNGQRDAQSPVSATVRSSATDGPAPNEKKPGLGEPSYRESSPSDEGNPGVNDTQTTESNQNGNEEESDKGTHKANDGQSGGECADRRAGAIMTEALADAISESASQDDGKGAYRVYTRRFDRVSAVPDAKDSDIRSMLNGKHEVARRLRRGLGNALRSAERRWWRDDQKSGQLSPRRLYRLCCQVPCTSVFRTRAKVQGRSTAVSVLVDASGSMTSRKMAITRDALRAVLEALSDLRVPSEALTFTTGDRINWRDLATSLRIDEQEIRNRYTRISNLEIGRIQEFGEPVSAAMRRLPMIRCSGLTPLGEAMQVAARRLVGRVESRKILLVLTDGRAGCESGPAAAVCHAQMVAQMAVKAGIELVGVGILDSNLCDIIPDTIVINQIEELPTRLCGSLGRTLTKGMKHVG